MFNDNSRVQDVRARIINNDDGSYNVRLYTKDGLQLLNVHQVPSGGSELLDSDDNPISGGGSSGGLDYPVIPVAFNYGRIRTLIFISIVVEGEIMPSWWINTESALLPMYPIEKDPEGKDLYAYGIKPFSSDSWGDFDTSKFEIRAVTKTGFFNVPYQVGQDDEYIGFYRSDIPDGTLCIMLDYHGELPE